jgi:hypothetical protein
MPRAIVALLFAASAAIFAATRPDRLEQQREIRATIEPRAPGTARVLTSVDALPAHLAIGFTEPAAFVRTASGEYLVFDRRAQAVYAIDAARTAARKIVEIGEERGRIIRPTAFAPGADGSFVVADQPRPGPRIQRFAERGYLLNGFSLPVQPGPQLVLNGVVVGGIGAMQYAGDSIFLNLPASGSLIAEYSWDGRARRAIGSLRPTGQESDRIVHLALNSGLPLANPAGGFYFVFQAGVPVFRKYGAAGDLVFERHIEGRELDDTLRAQPTTWPKRRTGDGGEWPVVPVVVRTAALDFSGNLWVALADGPVYVYSPDGEKVATLRLRAAGDLAPTSLFFGGRSRLLVTPGCYIFDTAPVSTR